jgi:Uncharacterized protein conserved in bacteria
MQEEIYDRAAVLCSRSEKSSAAIRKKLVEWGLKHDETDEVIEKLIEENFINDVRYACSYVRDKFRFNKWGKIKITFNLKAENISSEIIQQALEGINDEDYYNTLTELVTSKNKSIKAVNIYDRKSKLLRFAQSRGFESGIILEVLDRICPAKNKF